MFNLKNKNMKKIIYISALALLMTSFGCSHGTVGGGCAAYGKYGYHKKPNKTNHGKEVVTAGRNVKAFSQ